MADESNRDQMWSRSIWFVRIDKSAESGVIAVYEPYEICTRTIRRETHEFVWKSIIENAAEQSTLEHWIDDRIFLVDFGRYDARSYIAEDTHTR